MVIFFDNCIPVDPFAEIFVEAEKFADIIFLNEPHVKDYVLFSKVEERRQKEFPERLCVFVTCDTRFDKQVADHVAYLDGSVRLVVVKKCGGNRKNNIMRAEQTLQKIKEMRSKFLSCQGLKK